jgi:CRP-like cAMP-binding protein
MRTALYQNEILNALAPEVVSRLQLTPVDFALSHAMEYPGVPIAHLYFVESGMASMTTTFRDGSQVEVGMFGRESVIGVSALMGTRNSLNRIYTQIAGDGFSCPLAAGRREFAQGGHFQRLALRSVQIQLLQAMQSAGCNARHHFTERLARWLLITADRANRDTFTLSQEFLAEMLGGSRPTVSIAAGILKDRGLIEYNRGVIHILNVPALERAACECYLDLKRYLDNALEFEAD